MKGAAAAPTVVAFAVVVTGFAIVELDSWRPGAAVIGAGILLASVLRLVLPNRLAGWLEVRAKAVDVTVLTLLGAAIVALALNIPSPQ